jgi:hypothetical protein
MAKFLYLAAVATVALVAAGSGYAVSPPRDRLPPTTPTVDGARTTADLRPTFHFGARDNRTPPSQIRFLCAIDTPLLHPCARVYQAFSALAFGTHVLRVEAIDRAHNVSLLSTINFAVVGRWDAAQDFPRAPQAENPAHDQYGNTVWFYLYSTAPVHDPTQYRPLPEFHVIDGANQQWNLGLHPDSTIITPLVGTNWPQALMVFHPDRDRFAVLGWRSPYTGKITIEIELNFPDPAVQAGSNGIVWSIDRESSVLRSELLTPGNQARAALTLDVSTGDTFYLVINNNGDSNWDTTVGQFTVQTIPG